MRKKLLMISVVSTILFGFFVVTFAGMDKKEKNELFKQVELFSDSLAIIQSDYVEEVTPKDLIYGALKGMLSALDPHSQFLDPQTYSELKLDTEGKFGGLGIEITIKDSLLTVVTPIEDTPAWKAGLKANDRIVKIDSELTRNITLTDAVKKLRGDPGTSVILTILREAEKKLLEFKITRDIIKIRNVKEGRILENGIGYIRLIEFRENAVKEMNQALKNLAKEGMNALILDLRNNPGGLLDIAVKVAEKFLEKDKMVVYTKGRIPSQDLEFLSKEAKPIIDIPIVVLINEGSASGSEIVAGCLQDYKRAIILGTQSFGKGSVQTVIPLRDGSALRLTTSKYFTPQGKVIHEKGVTPDIIVEEGRIEIVQESVGLESLHVFDDIEEKEDKEKKDQEEVFDYKSDNQLMRAVDVLKALKFYEQSKAE
ncbi:MAG: S41 family peptidase [Candidatus Omnitrophica bacterium]|nr:S41 family peptidase [Candidatus Omnitrophota bacterium]